jgi:hypothetical protein
MGDTRRLVLVERIDFLRRVVQAGGEIEDCAPGVMTCRSVGWLLHDAADCKAIVPHIAGPEPDVDIAEQGCGDITIPTAAILSIVDSEAKT